MPAHQLRHLSRLPLTPDVRGRRPRQVRIGDRLEGWEALVAELGLDGRARLDGPVPRTEVPALLAAATALVNNMKAGAPDKVVYEAAASCVPVLASNPVFDELFAGLEPELAFARERPEVVVSSPYVRATRTADIVVARVR